MRPGVFMSWNCYIKRMVPRERNNEDYSLGRIQHYVSHEFHFAEYLGVKTYNSERKIYRLKDITTQAERIELKIKDKEKTYFISGEGLKLSVCFDFSYHINITHTSFPAEMFSCVVLV